MLHTLSLRSLLLAAGEKGKRIALPNSEIMIHQPSGGSQGQATDIAIQAEQILKTKNKLNQILAECTGQPLDKVKLDVERDYYMNPQEALAYGLVDKIIDFHV
ncbi:ATP-dependent Clp protease proteolytic subunit [bioreactor metagenome]|uniref:endopeptidase Clp n=1 Tax=bioreactor metagenome TaxID=1076179 RepID=A0A645IS83_9ZZZZ